MVKKYPDIKVLDTQPADWDVTKVARIWETLLTKYPKINAAYFHNDDMALAAYNVMKRAQPHRDPDRWRATPCRRRSRRSSTAACSPRCAIRPAASMAARSSPASRRLRGEKTGDGIPKNIIADGPVVTKANAEGMLWMESHFLI